MLGSQDLDSNYHYAQPLTIIRTEADLALLASIEPLLLHQQTYIGTLERDLSAVTHQLSRLEGKLEQRNLEYDSELEKLTA